MGRKCFGAAALASKLLCMSVQARHSNPAIPYLRDSKLGIQFMHHADPRLQHEITHLFHFPWAEIVGQLMPEAIGRIRIFLPCNAFRNDPLHLDSVNREKIGSGCMGVTDRKRRLEEMFGSISQK